MLALVLRGIVSRAYSFDLADLLLDFFEDFEGILRADVGLDCICVDEFA